jgi:hypothetical protein
MVGFIKELVDEQAAASIAMGHKAGWRRSKFKNLLITPGIVFVTKAADKDCSFSSLGWISLSMRMAGALV